eukprot:CFRG2602T1
MLPPSIPSSNPFEHESQPSTPQRPTHLPRRPSIQLSYNPQLAPPRPLCSVSADSSPTSIHVRPAVSPGTSSIMRGLVNRPGENICFLNVLVQILFHLDSFRLGLHAITNHHCPQDDKDSCVLSVLQNIFTEYEFGGDGALKAGALLKALRSQYAKEGRFKENDMDDAAETFEAICTTVHSCLTGSKTKDHRMRCDPPCFIHDIFSVSVQEKYMCPCGGRNVVTNYEREVNYISTTAIVNTAKQARAYAAYKSSMSPNLCDSSATNRFSAFNVNDIIPMDQIVNALVAPDTQTCDKCNQIAHVEIQRTGTLPTCVVFGLVWEQNVHNVDISRVLEQIQPLIDLNKLYGSEQISKCGVPMRCHAMICYYGKHYVSYFYSTKDGTWFQADDVRIKQVGHSWYHLLMDCRRGKFQPVLIFYQACDRNTSQMAGKEYIADMKNYFEEKSRETHKDPRSPRSVHNVDTNLRCTESTSQQKINTPNQSPMERNMEGDMEEKERLELTDLALALDMQEREDTTISMNRQLPREQSVDRHVEEKERLELADLALALDIQERGDAVIKGYPSSRGPGHTNTIQYSGVLQVYTRSGLMKDWKTRNVEIKDGNLTVMKISKENSAKSDLQDFKIYGLQKYLIIDDSGLKKFRKSPEKYRWCIKDKEGKAIGTFAAFTFEEKHLWLQVLGGIGCTVRFEED